MQIHSVTEKGRGCGSRACRPTDKRPYRLYLAMPGEWVACGRLPFPLHSCSSCGGGIRPTMRGTYQWFNPREIIGSESPLADWVDSQLELLQESYIRDSRYPLDHAAFEAMGDITPLLHSLIANRGKIGCNKGSCRGCRLSPEIQDEKALLIWVGAKFYPTRQDFMREAVERGLSRRLASLPRGFVPGETSVYFAHPKAIMPWERGWVAPQGCQYSASSLGPLDPSTSVEAPQGEVDQEPQPGIITSGTPTLEVVVPTTNPDEVDEYVHYLADHHGDAVRVLHVTPAEDEQLEMGE